ncbi:MAG: glycosyltransferase family 4 protein [Gaiellaceae bacterium]
MSPPTVAFVSQPWARLLPPSESVAIGTREVARRLAGELRMVVYARGQGSSVEVEHEDGVEYRLVPAERDWRAMKAAAPARLLATRRRPFFAGPFFHPVYFQAVVHDVVRLQPAIVIAHNFSQLLRPLRRAAPGSRRVLQMHCDWLAGLSRPMLARRLAAADLVLGCSEHVTRQVRERFPGVRAETCYNGVDVDRFRPGPARPQRTIVFAGRLAPDKGVHVLCDAFRLVRRTLPDARLELVGPEAPVPREMQVALSDDPLVQGLEVFYDSSYVAALRERLGGDVEAVAFRGAVAAADMPAAYTRGTVGVLPSLEEAFGLPLVEAMACGLPTVATRVGGMPELLVDGETGLLVPPADADALAEALVRLLEDAPLAERLGAAGRARAVEGFSWDVVAEQTLALLRPLLAGAR